MMDNMFDDVEKGDQFTKRMLNRRSSDYNKSLQRRQSIIQSINTDFNMIDYEQANQKSQNSMNELNLYKPPGEISQKMENERRMSIGEYFGSISQGEMNIPFNTTNKIYKDKFEQRDNDLQRRDSDLFFNPRVLEILEPEVVNVERKSNERRVSNRRRASDIKFVQETFKNIQLEDSDTSMTTSLLSEDTKEHEQEIDKKQFQPSITEQQPQNTTDSDFNSNTTRTYYNFEKDTSSAKEFFAPPMPMKIKNVNRQKSNQQDPSGVFSLKRNTSFILKNLQMPKLIRCKSNIESARKVVNSASNMISKNEFTNQSKHNTLNRTLSMYKTLTHRIKKKFRGSIIDEPKPTSEDILSFDVNSVLCDNVKNLLSEVELQQTFIYQASKALELCNSMREFMASSERVESERFLFLASLRKRVAIEEIRRLINQKPEPEYVGELAEVNLKEMSLQLREDVLRRERQNGGIAEWFIIIVAEGLTVWATHAVACPISSPRLYFPGQLSIPGLKPNFRLSLKVYSLQLQQIIYNHEDKYHIAQNVSNSKNSSTTIKKKLLKRSWSSKKKKPEISPKQFEIKLSGVKESSFVMCGSVDFVLHDLHLQSPWPLNGVPTNSVLHGTIDLKFSCKLQLSISHAGFLTHGDETGEVALWNRRWCVLKGYNILFWNYPREQDYKPPLYTIDLVNCVSRQIDLIDRSLCAKPRTLLIETATKYNVLDKDSLDIENSSNCTIVRNLLSYDTKDDLNEWQTKLNHALSALQEWHIVEKLPEVSDL